MAWGPPPAPLWRAPPTVAVPPPDHAMRGYCHEHVVDPCRQGLDPYGAPPGAVPFDRYLEAVNRTRPWRDPDRVELSDAAQSRCAAAPPKNATPLLDAKIGEVPPLEPKQRTLVTERESRRAQVGTGNLIDITM